MSDLKEGIGSLNYNTMFQCVHMFVHICLYISFTHIHIVLNMDVHVGQDVILLPEFQPETTESNQEEEVLPLESCPTTEVAATTSTLTPAKVQMDISSEGLKTSDG